MNEKQRLLRSVRAIVSAIESLTESEIEALVTGEGKLAFAKIQSNANSSEGVTIDHEASLRELETCKDRDVAFTILKRFSNRDSVASLARSLKIHVTKADRRDEIESKIVEFVIGGRLRTEAIQSLNLRGGSSTKGT